MKLPLSIINYNELHCYKLLSIQNMLYANKLIIAIIHHCFNITFLINDTQIMKYENEITN